MDWLETSVNEKKVLDRETVIIYPCGMFNVFATAPTPPLDLTTVGSDVASFIAAAALAGVAVLGALYGIRVIIRAFKSVK